MAVRLEQISGAWRRFDHVRRLQHSQHRIRCKGHLRRRGSSCTRLKLKTTKAKGLQLACTRILKAPISEADAFGTDSAAEKFISSPLWIHWSFRPSRHVPELVRAAAHLRISQGTGQLQTRDQLSARTGPIDSRRSFLRLLLQFTTPPPPARPPRPPTTTTTATTTSDHFISVTTCC